MFARKKVRSKGGGELTHDEADLANLPLYQLS